MFALSADRPLSDCGGPPRRNGGDPDCSARADAQAEGAALCGDHLAILRERSARRRPAGRGAVAPAIGTSAIRGVRRADPLRFVGHRGTKPSRSEGRNFRRRVPAGERRHRPQSFFWFRRYTIERAFAPKTGTRPTDTRQRSSSARRRSHFLIRGISTDENNSSPAWAAALPARAMQAAFRATLECSEGRAPNGRVRGGDAPMT
jgi:hypothetical protein